MIKINKKDLSEIEMKHSLMDEVFTYRWPLSFLILAIIGFYAALRLLPSDLAIALQRYLSIIAF